MNVSLQKTVESASRGDAAAVDVLLERFLPGLEAFVRLRSGKLLQAKESCADLVQSVCREVLEDLDKYHYENEVHFKRWLYFTAQRKILKRYEYYLSEKRNVNKEARPPAGADSNAHAEQLYDAYRTFSTPSRKLMIREEIAKIESAFAELPEEYREVILLNKIMGMSHAEVAKEMNKTEVATRSLLFRALGRLSTLLDARS